MTARETIEALYAAYNRHEAGDAASLYAPSGRHEEIATSQRKNGPKAIEEGLEHFFRAFPDARWQPAIIVADDLGAAATYVLTGTLSARLGPFEPRGQQIELRGVHILQIGASGIDVSEDYWDASTFGKQMMGH